jgi:hypothetical protein
MAPIVSTILLCYEAGKCAYGYPREALVGFVRRLAEYNLNVYTTNSVLIVNKY